eukprot:jgi/Psemu1/306063/fgenesh1_kg.232_\
MPTTTTTKTKMGTAPTPTPTPTPIRTSAHYAAEHEHEHEQENLHTKRQVRGAAVAGGVTGLVLLGPAAGLLAAGGAALATTSGKGKVGETARATGDSISDLGKSIKKFDEKHRIKEKTSESIVKGCKWITKKLDAKKK